MVYGVRQYKMIYCMGMIGLFDENKVTMNQESSFLPERQLISHKNYSVRLSGVCGVLCVDD